MQHRTRHSVVMKSDAGSATTSHMVFNPEERSGEAEVDN